MVAPDRTRSHSPADRHEVVHSDALHDQELSCTVGLAVQVMRGLRRPATLARQEPIGVAGRLGPGERVAFFRRREGPRPMEMVAEGGFPFEGDPQFESLFLRRRSSGLGRWMRGASVLERPRAKDNSTRENCRQEEFNNRDA